MRLRQSFLRIASRAILTCRADELRMVAICKDIRSWRVDLRAFLSLALGRRQEAGAVQPVEDRSGKAVAGRPVASVA
jgi:hypothetical protein